MYVKLHNYFQVYRMSNLQPAPNCVMSLNYSTTIDFYCCQLNFEKIQDLVTNGVLHNLLKFKPSKTLSVKIPEAEAVIQHRITVS